MDKDEANGKKPQEVRIQYWWLKELENQANALPTKTLKSDTMMTKTDAF